MMQDIDSHFFTTSDGAGLHYIQAGKGEILLMLPGAGFSADLFRYQLAEFAQNYHVIVLDKRGHGKSEKVDFGYRVSRFAKDLHELLTHLDLQNVTVLAHSIGAAMVYNYLDLFGSGRIGKLIVVDEPAVLLINPAWSADERTQYGAIYDAGTLHQLTNGFTDTSDLNRNIVDMMTTRHASEEQKQFILGCMQIPGSAAARLYFNNICQDFRDVLHKIDVPTLFITGKASLHPWQSHQWMYEQVQDSSLEVFAEEEGGNHFMFVENPEKFNRIVTDFLTAPQA